MTTYIISFACNMLLGLLFCIDNRGVCNYNELNLNTKKRKLYLLITALQLGLICGLRSANMAYDTGAYQEIFDDCPDTWQNIFKKSAIMHIEMGFRVFCSIIKILGGNFQTMLLITSLFVMGSCCIFLYRHSKNVLLSVFIIISFPYFYSSFDIIRHFIATSFLLLGYKYIVEKKPIKYMLFILMGCLFQTSALIFLPLYFLGKLKWNLITVGIASVATAGLYLYIEPIAVVVGDLIGKSDGVESGWIGSYGGGMKTALMYGVILLIAILAFHQLKNRSKEDAIALNIVALMFISSVLFINARMMTRAIMTLVALMAIAMPQLLDKQRSKVKQDCKLLKLGLLGVGMVYHIFMLTSNWQNVVPYIPFWK